MDADDIALEQRLARQVAFMDVNRDVDVCGTWLRTFGARRRRDTSGAITPAAPRSWRPSARLDRRPASIDSPVSGTVTGTTSTHSLPAPVVAFTRTRTW
jgi:hypothetical protein